MLRKAARWVMTDERGLVLVATVAGAGGGCWIGVDIAGDVGLYRPQFGGILGSIVGATAMGFALAFFKHINPSELALCPDEKSKSAGEAFLQAAIFDFRGWPKFVLSALLGVSLALAMPSTLLMMLAVVACLALGIMWMICDNAARSRRGLRRLLLDHGVPICLNCGYDLRGQKEPRCPECATPFDPALLQPQEEV